MELKHAFSGTNRQERIIHAERIGAVFDFTAFFAVHAIPLVRLMSSACFLITKDEEGRTIVRSKKHSHFKDWEDDGTVVLFHVIIAYCCFTSILLPQDRLGIYFLKLFFGVCI